ncbi:MAG TPA: hypothetical protein PK523_04865, partial [Elusimicrobiales bacterium]|nr:hypothetical protein [Elusimicrobiales bacterium]
SDLEAGRTLKDIHGNMVRVEQRLIRPDPKTLQFFNIVKRPSYKDYDYSSPAADQHGGFIYNGDAVTNRMDMFQVNLNFDRDLPQRIEEWPSFFNDNDINPAYMTAIAANRTDIKSEIFFVAEGWKYDAGRDELVNNIKVVDPAAAVNSTTDRDVVITGVLKPDAGNPAYTPIYGLSKISNLEIVDAGGGALDYTNAINGTSNGVTVGGPAGDVVWAIRTTDADYSVDSDDVGTDQMWQFQADRYNVGNAGAQYIWLAQENYVIGNGGGLKNTGDFTSSGTDPFSILKETAGQVIMYVKNDTGGVRQTTDRFGASGRNIDIVFIPDLAIAAIQRMLPAITELGD